MKYEHYSLRDDMKWLDWNKAKPVDNATNEM